MDHCQVEKIEPGTVVTLRTSKGTIRARKVILTPGAWAGQMSSQLGFDLPLKVMEGKGLSSQVLRLVYVKLK